ncbi:MAG: hypothetical protein AAB603_03875 [Patescibacteria group bacterium]
MKPMEINWQDVFYITSSIAMITAFFVLIWLLWLFFVATKLIKNFTFKIQQWDHNVDEIKYLITDVKLKVSKFLLKILDKKSKKI